MRFTLIKAIGGPGSAGFLVAVFAVTLLLLMFRRTRRTGRRLGVGLVALYLLLSLPVVALGIVRLIGAGPPDPLVGLDRIDNVFVFDGDNRFGRGRCAGEWWTRRHPELFWVLGGDELKNAMEDAGVPTNHWIWGGVPDKSTYGQVTVVKERVEAIRLPRAGIIVSRLQAPRVRGLVRHLRVEAAVIGSEVDAEPAVGGVRFWLPSADALAVSREALYEGIALLFYRWKGWI
jgi:hypothetical protein